MLAYSHNAYRSTHALYGVMTAQVDCKRLTLVIETNDCSLASSIQVTNASRLLHNACFTSTTIGSERRQAVGHRRFRERGGKRVRNEQRVSVSYTSSSMNCVARKTGPLYLRCRSIVARSDSLDNFSFKKPLYSAIKRLSVTRGRY